MKKIKKMTIDDYIMLIKEIGEVIKKSDIDCMQKTYVRISNIILLKKIKYNKNELCNKKQMKLMLKLLRQYLILEMMDNYDYDMVFETLNKNHLSRLIC